MRVLSIVAVVLAGISFIIPVVGVFPFCVVLICTIKGLESESYNGCSFGACPQGIEPTNLVTSSLGVTVTSVNCTVAPYSPSGASATKGIAEISKSLTVDIVVTLWLNKSG